MLKCRAINSSTLFMLNDRLIVCLIDCLFDCSIDRLID